MERKLIGRCGKYCGECRIYLAGHGGPETIADVAQSLGLTVTAVTCEGCQGPAESCFNRECALVTCLNEHGYRYCAQCAEINDCTKYARLNAEHGGIPKINSTQLKQWGEDRWLHYHLGDDNGTEGDK